MTVQFQSFQGMGVLAEGLDDPMPQALGDWLIEHLFERKVHLAPSVVLAYVPDRFEVHCLGIQIPLDTSECQFVKSGFLKPKALEQAKRTTRYLRLGNVHLDLAEQSGEPLQTQASTHLVCDAVLRMFAELRKLAEHALHQRLGLLKKKEATLAGRPEVMRITNRQHQLICEKALVQLAGIVNTG